MRKARSDDGRKTALDKGEVEGEGQNKVKTLYAHVGLVAAGGGHAPSFGSFGVNGWRFSILVCTVNLPVQVLKHVLVAFPGVHNLLRG